MGNSESLEIFPEFKNATLRLTDSILIVGGTVLGFSVGFLANAESLKSTEFLRIAWVFLAVAIFANITSKGFDYFMASTSSLQHNRLYRMFRGHSLVHR